ncbi:MAG: DNA-binding protein WhiA [Coriobacteriales bacterium]|nr:DNA-binding protein WhiA [Coriobacteriales bacterium]
MSFASTVRVELSRVPWECEDCKVAELSALIRIDGNLSANYRLEIATETASVARRVVSLIHELYGLKTEITTRRSVLHKSYNYLIMVPAQIGLKEALDNLGIITERGLDLGIDPKLVKKDCCKVAYLRGAFIGGGFIADPNGDSHLEMTTPHEELATALVDLKVELGIPAKVTRRRNTFVIYLKGADLIVEFLGRTGAHNAVLNMESIRVTKSVRNDVNRRLNAEVANQAKTINAAMDQVDAIRQLVDTYGIESLSPALQELALLRLANPEASLRELGELANPPLSKSAVYHRIRRIEAMARELE